MKSFKQFCSVLVEELQDVAKIGTNMKDADFWLERRGSQQTVGRVHTQYAPQHIGVKVHRTDIVHPKYLQYSMINMHNQGTWARQSTGTTNLVNIRTADVKKIKLGEDYVYTNNKGKRRAGDYHRHEFEFKPQGQQPVRVHVHNEPKSKTGFVYIPDIYGGTTGAGANRFGPGVLRQAMPIIHRETGLTKLQGRRDTGAGPGRRQSIKIT